MKSERISEYRVMWLMVLFDLPTETKRDIRAYSVFRKNLMKDGFTMFQFSIYIRHCASMENAEMQAYSSFCRLIFWVRCSIAQIAGWLYSEYSKSLYTFAMQSEA